jgi:hypothetical protein
MLSGAGGIWRTGFETFAFLLIGDLVLFSALVLSFEKIDGRMN